MHTSQCGLSVSIFDGCLQRLGGNRLSQADILQGVGVPCHEGHPLGIVSMGAQQGKDLVLVVRQYHVALQVMAGESHHLSLLTLMMVMWPEDEQSSKVLVLLCALTVVQFLSTCAPVMCIYLQAMFSTWA